MQKDLLVFLMDLEDPFLLVGLEDPCLLVGQLHQQFLQLLEVLEDLYLLVGLHLLVDLERQ